MFCNHCGNKAENTDKFCSACGAPLQTAPQESRPRVSAEANSLGFFPAVALFFKNYTNFKGRSRRGEYWWAWLFTMLVSTILTVSFPETSGLWALVIFLPSLSLAVRRLHDIGKSGWWLCISIIPLVGSILLLIWYCRDSDPAVNQWGRSPKY